MWGDYDPSGSDQQNHQDSSELPASASCYFVWFECEWGGCLNDQGFWKPQIFHWVETQDGVWFVHLPVWRSSQEIWERILLGVVCLWTHWRVGLSHGTVSWLYFFSSTFNFTNMPIFASTCIFYFSTGRFWYRWTVSPLLGCFINGWSVWGVIFLIGQVFCVAALLWEPLLVVLCKKERWV